MPQLLIWGGRAALLGLGVKLFDEGGEAMDTARKLAPWAVGGLAVYLLMRRR